MIITVPYIKNKEMVEGEIKVTRGTLELEIDLSFMANLKWEEEFQQVAGYDLITYTEMVKKWTLNESPGKSHFVGMLKLMYCYVNSDKLPTFKSFAKLFDYSVANEILEQLKVVFEQLEKSASKN